MVGFGEWLGAVLCGGIGVFADVGLLQHDQVCFPASTSTTSLPGRLDLLVPCEGVNYAGRWGSSHHGQQLRRGLQLRLSIHITMLWCVWHSPKIDF